VEHTALSERKEEATNRIRARDVGTPAALDTSARTDRRKMMVINLDRLASYEGTARDE
jgi:hypothetical protein